MGLLITGVRDDLVTVGQGVENEMKLNPFGDQVITPNGYGQFYDAARKGKLFTLATAVGATLNGQTNPLGAAGTALLALYNPNNSGIAAVILRASCNIVIGASATSAAPCWNYIPSNTSHGITAAGSNGAFCTRLDGTQSSIKTFVGAALTGSIASTFLRNWMGSQAEPRHAGAASENGVNMITEETDGSIIVVPGSVLIANMSAAGAALTGCMSVLFAEVPYPN